MANRATVRSRYQTGLPYDPAMTAGSYRPERMTRPQTPPGDYGVTPIQLPNGDGGGVNAPLATEGGSGLGGGLSGASLLGLLNPNALNTIRDAYNRLTGSGNIATVPQDSGIQLPAGVPFNQGPRPTANLPMSDLPPAMVDEASYAPVAGTADQADKAAGVLGDMGAGTWQEGVLGTGNGSGGLFGYGGMSAFPAGTGAVPWEGLAGTADLGSLGSLDFSSMGLGMLGGALGNYMVHQSNYNGTRDPAGRDIGAAIGSTIGGIIGGPVAPITAFLGAQFGGMIGGQFGPQTTFGPIAENGMYLNGGNWDIRAGADNGATADPAFGNAMRDSINALMAQRGYEYTPGGFDQFALGWNAGGDATRAQRGGFYVRPGGSWATSQDPNNTAVYFGNSLNDAYVPYVRQDYVTMPGFFSGAPTFADSTPYLPSPYGYGNANNGDGFPLDMAFLQAPNGMTVGDAMTGYLFNDLAVNGAIRPIGGEAYQAPRINGTPIEQSVG